MMRRSHLASLLKEHCLVEGGESNVKQWLKDEGLDASVAGALKVCFQATMGTPRWCLDTAFPLGPRKLTQHCLSSLDARFQASLLSCPCT